MRSIINRSPTRATSLALALATELIALALVVRSTRRAPLISDHADADGWITAEDGPKPSGRAKNRRLHVANDHQSLRFA